MQNRRIVVLFAILVVILIILASLSLIIMAVPRSNLWASSVTQIDKLHELGFDGTGVTIGIIDTGLSMDHHEFDASTFVAWIDTINNNSQFYDDEDHGTHVAGILASKESIQGRLSGINMKGIISGADFIVAKSIPRNQYLFGGGNDSTIADGLKFCIENGADIILLSMGMSPDYVDFNESSKTSEMIDQAIENGIFVVAPAGNDGQNDDGDVCFPAILDNVIAVGALSNGNALLSFSSRGHQYPSSQHPNKKPELVAPGDRILSTRVNGAYGELSGTSQASAHVAGVIGLLLDAYPEYRHDGVKNYNETTIQLFKEIFAKTSRKVGSLMGNEDEWSHDDLYGYGLIQAYEAYKELAKH
ncbi:MAG: S8 family serine peptidase [Thermoplasmatales archaeon]|nr:MAG: S8 family serine peptidase [Thermoplasmatales archaeon]